MLQHQATIDVRTKGRGFHELTRDVAAIVARSGVKAGLCVVYCTHTSASLVITENADPSARADVMRRLERIAPDGDPADEHDAEGEDDSPAHQRSAITRTSETIPIADGRLALGTWQGIFLAEHRVRPQSRRVVVHVLGAR